MAMRIEQFDNIEILKSELKESEKKNGGNYCWIITSISLAFGIFSLLVFLCRFLINQKVDDIESLQVFYNRLYIVRGCEYISAIFSVMYYLIFHTVESKRVEKHQNQVNKIKSESKHCWAAIHEHYLKFNNAPVDYMHCNPTVLNLIIKELEDNENCTLRQALFQVDKICHVEND